MTHYVFYNQWQAILYMGYHYKEEEAWNAMFHECKYPNDAKNIEVAKQQGIYFTKSS